MLNVKCVVSCRDANGTPTFFPCVVTCSEEEYDEGDHYVMASWQADDAGYEDISMVYDEFDGPEWLFSKMHSEEIAK